MAENFDTARPKPPTEMVVDYEHMSAGPPQVSPAAGWVKSLELSESGNELFATVTWTDEAAQQIVARQYRFISPEFNLEYRDKETGKVIGPTLIAVALTNRPFLEGMQPVALSEALCAMVLSEITLGMQWAMSEWDNAYIDNLPDDAFAVISSGGKKDAEGNTEPRALRHLPYKDAQGNIDLPHLRNALARLPQTSLNPEEKVKAEKVLAAAVKETQNTKAKELSVDEATIRKILNLTEGANLEDELKKLTASANSASVLLVEKANGDKLIMTLTEAKNAAEAKLTEALAREQTAEVDKIVTAALTDGKIIPAQKEWARAYCLKDRDGFSAFIASAIKVGPDMRVLGKEQTPDVTLTDAERKIAKQFGLSEEQVTKQKAADSAK